MANRITPRGPELPIRLNGIDYPSDMAQEMLFSAVAELTANLPEDQGIDRPAVLTKIGARDPETRSRLRNMIQRLMTHSDGGRRAARLKLMPDKSIRLTEAGLRLGTDEDDPTARVLLGLIRERGGIASGRQLRRDLGMKGRKARAQNYEIVTGDDGKLRRVARDPIDVQFDLERDREISEGHQADFQSFRKVLQTHPRISRIYRDALGQDGLYALAPAELAQAALSGFSRRILIKAALSASGRPSEDDVDHAFAKEVVIVGAALRELREQRDMTPMEWVEQPGVADALDLIYDAAIDTSVFNADLQPDEGWGRYDDMLRSKAAPHRERETSVEEMREALKDGGFDPERAGAVLKLDKIEQGDMIIHHSATARLFETCAAPYHSAADLSRGLLRLDSVWVEHFGEEIPNPTA